MNFFNFKNYYSMIKIIIGVALLSSSAFAAPAIWDGSADVSWYDENTQTYNLNTAEQLAGLAQLVNDGISSFEGKTITLGADIFLNDTLGANSEIWVSASRKKWTPIGTSSHPFKGDFDGLSGKKSRTIFGLFFDDSSQDDIGLFGYALNANIRNFELNVGYVSARKNVGGIAGFASASSIINVHSKVDVLGKRYVGGLVGHGENSNLHQVSARASITGADSVVGGLAGAISSIQGSEENKSFFVGVVNGNECVGGLAGIVYNTIKNSYFKGNVEGKARFTGGLVGSLRGSSFSGSKIASSFAEGEIVGSACTGGLIGYIHRSSGRAIVDSSYFNGNVSGTDYVGGIAGGYLDGRFLIKDSYSEGFVSGTNDYVGGFAGKADTIVNSYHKGDVSGRKDYVGGLAGYCHRSIINSYSEGAVTGANYVGGLVGFSYIISSSYHKNGDVIGKGDYVGGLVGDGRYIDHSYSEGTVVSNGYYVGGVAGFSWNVDSSYHVGGDVDGLGYVGGLSGYTYGSINHSYSKGNVIGKGNYIGGLTGFLSHCNRVSDACRSKDSITYSYSIGNVEGAKYVGGLIGLDTVLVGLKVGTKSIKYFHSYSSGTVNGTAFVGGLLGRSSLSSVTENEQIIKIDSCYHGKGDVIGDSAYVGGLVGYYARGEVLNSYSKGNVSGNYYIGGLLGFSTQGLISNSYFEGDVAGLSDYVGGLIGLSYLRTNLTSSKDFIATANTYVKGNVEGRNYVGGLFGKDSLYDQKGYKDSSDYSIIRKFLNSSSQGNVNGEKFVGGLIGMVDYGLFKDSLLDIKVVIDSFHHELGNVKGSSYVGGIAGLIEIAGLLNTTSITNSSHKGDVQGSGDYVGGLVGEIQGISTIGSYYFVENSYSIGNIQGKNYVGGAIGSGTITRISNSNKYHEVRQSIKNVETQGSVTGKSYVGGVIGMMKRGDGNRIWSFSKIDSSMHRDGLVGGEKFVGGIVGYTNDSLSNSVSIGNMEGKDYVGGVAGYAGNMTSCSHTGGDVKGDNYIGGLAGFVTSSVSNSFSEGDIVATGYYVGGLLGYTNYAVSNSYSKGDVGGQKSYVGGLVGYGSSISQSYVNGNIAGSDDYVGGLIGYATSTVADSRYEGNVASTGNYVGGLIGRSHASGSESAEQTYVVVGNSQAIGSVRGANYVGGIIGLDSTYRYCSSNSSSCSKVTVHRNIVNVNFRGNVTGFDYVGGIVGKMHCVSGSSNFYSNIKSSWHADGYVVGAGYVGGIAGYTYGSLSNSYSKGRVTGSKNYVGGVSGYAVTVNTCYHIDGNIEGLGSVGGLTGSGSVTSSYHIGGDVLGTGDYVGGLTGSGSVSDSHSEGNVSGLDCVGGVAGSSSKIRNSYAKAAFVKGRNLVGGLAGSVSDSIKVSYFEGDSVTGIYQVGGLAGYAKSAVYSSYSTANVKGDDNVGGLIGSAYGNVSNSYALGNVDGDVDNSSTGNDNLGGLVGYQYSGSVSKSMALGDVTGTTKLGGLVGRFDGTSISNSYANGNVTGSYYGDTADEVGNYYIGGLVGFAKGSLSETYTSGIVKGIEGEPVYTGCMVGYVNGSLSVTNSYYDKSKCNLGIDGGENAVILAGTPEKTTAEMQSQLTFENWDFENTWSIKNNSYPFLQFCGKLLVNAVVSTDPLDGFVYDGKAKTPQVKSVLLWNDTLTLGTEYTVAFEKNVNAGTAYINICGIEPYSGCKIINFKINGIELKPTIAAIENVTYTGHAQTPEIQVYNGDSLLATTDYSIEYKDNINSGTATVVVTMKGNYSGSASKTFKIEKATPEISQNPKASDVVVGETLASSVLSGGYANVDGEFVWKTPSTKPSLENEGYAVVFVPADTNYTKSAEIIVPVKVLDVVYVAVHADTVTLDSTVLVKGAEYTLPEVPEKTGFDFKGFYKGKSEVGKVGDKIAINENTLIDAVYQVKMFMVTFLNGTAKLQTDEVAYGEMPEYKGAKTPTKTSTDKYTYTFKGWSPTITSVTGAATYTAVFDSTLRKYTVTFKNGTTTLQTSEIAYGSKPSYTGSNPTKPSTDKYTYTFKGWSPTIASVTGAATYTAVFDSTWRKYTITFKNGTTTLQTSDVAYGSKPSYTGSTPTKKATNKYTYKFKGWDPSIVAVTKAATYQAVFDSTKVTGIVDGRLVSLGVAVSAVSRTIQISAAPKNSTYTILDMQGRVLLRGRVESANFNIAVPSAGCYLVRVGNATRKVQVK